MADAYCSYCGGSHPRNLCPHTWSGSTNRSRLGCTYCGSSQHSVEFCPKSYGGNGNRRRYRNGSYLDR